MELTDALMQFDASVHRNLGEYMSEKGLLIYTPAESLIKNKVIYWGHNPGGDPECEHAIHIELSDALSRFPGQKCMIREAVWPNTRRSKVNGKYEDHELGSDPYQIGVAALLDGIGCPGALVTNFLFLQSKSASHLRQIVLRKQKEFKAFVTGCLAVHDTIANCTGAKVLITTSGVINLLLAQSAVTMANVPDKCFESGINGQKVKIWHSVTVGKSTLKLISTPHMSYWGMLTNEDKMKVKNETIAAIRREVHQLS